MDYFYTTIRDVSTGITVVCAVFSLIFSSLDLIFIADVRMNFVSLDCKIPRLVYYDQYGMVCAVGAEALPKSFATQKEEE